MMNNTLLLAALILSFYTMSSSSPPGTAEALSQSIVVIGLNAALQKRFILPPTTNLEPGSVHRAHACETGVGGKGQDVGVALSCLLAEEEQTGNDKVLLAQFLGRGPEGDAVSNSLRSLGLSDKLTMRNAAPLRTCTTIVGADEATELVETSGEVTGGEMDAMRDRVRELAAGGGEASCVCIMGSMPPGCHEDTYAELTSSLAGKDSLVLIDSVIGLAPLLGTLKTIFDNDSKREGGAVLKLNAAELCKLAGVTKIAGEATQVTMEELTSSTRGFVSRYENAIGALDYLCITDGRYPGHLVEIPKSADADDGAIRTWRLPAVDLSEEGTLYPIGAGDTVAAGTLAAWQYLHHHRKAPSGGGGNDNNKFFGVVPSKIGERLSERKAMWSSADEDDEDTTGDDMATAFAFGLACGSASCLRQENSVFRVEDAVKFFDGMGKPVMQ